MTPEELKHTKITVNKKHDDGTLEISTKSYYEDLAFSQVELERIVYTSRQSFFKDLMSCADLITSEHSPEVNIKIKSKRGEPLVITKRWVIEKQRFDRR